jgi:hypothetical protein
MLLGSGGEVEAPLQRISDLLMALQQIILTVGPMFWPPNHQPQILTPTLQQATKAEDPSIADTAMHVT